MFYWIFCITEWVFPSKRKFPEIALKRFPIKINKQCEYYDNDNDDDDGSLNKH